MEEKNKTFNYTYSARQQEEVQNIRKKYLPHEESKMDQLRKLDRQSAKKAQLWSVVLGVVGALIMGTGMSLVMTNIGEIIGLAGTLIPGIVIGVIGMIPVILAYPVYNRILKKERRRLAPEILRLTEELMQ